MKKLATIFAFLTLSSVAQAQDAFYVSGLLGIGSLNLVGSSQDKYDNELTYGLRGGLLFNDHVSGGIYLQRLTTRDGAGPNTTANNLMAEFTYYFNVADENSFWVSGLLGLTQFNVDGLNGTPGFDDSGTSYGVSAGYNFMMAPNFSLSPTLTYLYIDNVGSESFSEVSGLISFTAWL